MHLVLEVFSRNSAHITKLLCNHLALMGLSDCLFLLPNGRLCLFVTLFLDDLCLHLDLHSLLTVDAWRLRSLDASLLGQFYIHRARTVVYRFCCLNTCIDTVWIDSLSGDLNLWLIIGDISFWKPASTIEKTAPWLALLALVLALSFADFLIHVTIEK